MEAKEKWNLIVQQYRENYAQQENKIQNLWETYCSEIFGYSKLLEEFSSQINKGIGSHERVIPDIILKKDNKNIFDIELKQYNLCFSQAMEDQIKSYLELFHLSVGMVVCQKIYLYSYNYSKSELNKLVIEFNENDANGIRLIELLQKENFDENNIKDFIKEGLITKINIQNIKNEINSDLVKKLVVDYLETKYTQNEIDEGIKEFAFNVRENIRLDNTNVSSPQTKKTTSQIIDPNFPLEPMFMIIKTSDERVRSCKGSLYEATRHCWRVKYDKVIKYPYVLSVIKGYVKEVYKVKNWVEPQRWPNDGCDVSDRLEFVGEVAPDEIRSKWINKLIPEKFRKIGMASPTVFSDMK